MDINILRNNVFELAKKVEALEEKVETLESLTELEGPIREDILSLEDRVSDLERGGNPGYSVEDI